MPTSPSTITAHLRAALNTGDRLPLSQILHPDVHWTPAAHQGSPCHGRTEVLLRCSHLHTSGLRATVQETFTYPEATVLGLLVHPGDDPTTPRATHYLVFHHTDGLITRIRDYTQRHDALNAAYQGT